MDDKPFDITTLSDEVDVNEDAQMARDIRAGLLSDPKDLSPWPKYLYDDEGSRLFEEITALPEYYQTRTELSILEEKAAEIIARSNCREILELGSGSSTKTRTLIDAMLAAKEPKEDASYSPLDVSEGILVESGDRLTKDYPDLDVHGYVGDFDGSLEQAFTNRSGEDGSRLVLFLGGTIGNFIPQKRESFLKEIQAGLTPDDHLLVGMDLVKDRQTLEAAYDDEAGVTAKFNKNILSVLNEKLDSDFEADLFDHRAVFDEEKQRIEMWLDSREDQKVSIPKLDLEITFRQGEGMRTETSHKFTVASARRVFADVGLGLIELYTDERNLFGLALVGTSISR